MRIFSVRLPFGAWLREPVTAEELAAFIATGEAEGKVSPYQWQQKAGAQRANQPFSNGGMPQRDINSVSEPDNHIPPGFEGWRLMKNVGDLMRRLQKMMLHITPAFKTGEKNCWRGRRAKGEIRAAALARENRA